MESGNDFTILARTADAEGACGHGFGQVRLTLHMLFRVSKLARLALPALISLACGESTPAPKTADDKPEVEERHGSRPTMSSQIGGLNEEKVDAAFKSSLSGLER